MDWLVGQFKDLAPDIVAFQEVRLDTTIGPPTQHAQVTHLAQRLPGYNYVFQPAQLYEENSRGADRDEEGPAIFSRFPIVHTDYALLSRDPEDPEDVHQRLVLHAVLLVEDGPAKDSTSTASSPSMNEMPAPSRLVDVYTTHLSLSEAARNRTVVELWHFIRRSRQGSLQILAGDMNAEPDSPALRFWTGNGGSSRAAENVKAAESVEAAKSPGCGLDASVAPQFRDAWLELFPEPEPRSRDPAVRHEALTFPSDDPTKRIDLVLVDDTVGAWDVSVREVFLIGQNPVPGVGAESAAGLGMVHADSPLFASDHRGVVVRLEVATA